MSHHHVAVVARRSRVVQPARVRRAALGHQHDEGSVTLERRCLLLQCLLQRSQRERLQQHKAEMSSGVAEQQEALLQQKRAEADQLRQQRADIGTHQHNTKRLAQQRMRAMADAQKLHAQEVQQQKMQQRMLHEEELQRRRRGARSEGAG